MINGIEDLFDDSITNADYERMAEEFGFDVRELAKEMDGYQPTMTIKFSKESEDTAEPVYAYETDSGFDLHSTEQIVLGEFGRDLIPTGLHIDIPDGYEIQVRSKSGLALKQGLMVLNSPGTVDCFSEDMKILTTDGEKTINEIKIGEIVYSFNEETLEIEKDVISQIFDTEKQEILIIETESGILEVTPNTEVYTTKGIVLAKNLTENDEIINFFNQHTIYQ
jgi:dUTP pyrophosphatase